MCNDSHMLSVRHLSAVNESRNSERIFIKFHTGALEWLPIFSHFGYTLQQQWTLHMIFLVHFAKYLPERKILRTDVAWRNETRKLCPVHYMPRRCGEKWNTQFVSGTLYAQTLRQRMKHAIWVRYIICPDVASKNETRNLCPVHYTPRHCVKEWNT